MPANRRRTKAEPEPDLSDVFTEPTPDDVGSPGEENPEAGAGSFADDLGSPREVKPQPVGKRTSAASVISMLYGGVGLALVQSGSDVPVGRVLQFQAPLAGAKFDELIAHTWLDTFLQPLVKQADKMEGIGALVMFPLLVGAYERNPAMGTMVEPILREVIRANLVDLAPVVRKQNSDTKRAAAALTDVAAVMGLDKGVDPIDAVLAAIFDPGEPEPTPDE